ncbi:protease inhibitor I9 family protein [Streptomyces sp. NPDC002054]|uniref:protease inhibitor I9 family protein n=1 Tax=Streptomyces sp. NPDC002054 TaxID=3154663 RepID=UPI0033297E2C
MRVSPNPVLSPVLNPVLSPVLAAVAVLLLVPVPAASAAFAAPAPDTASYRLAESVSVGRFMVTLAPDADPYAVMQETGVAAAHFVYRSAVRGFVADLDERQLAAVGAHPAVTAVEPDGTAVGLPVEDGPAV